MSDEGRAAVAVTDLLDRAVAAAQKIEGWMSPDELRWLGEQAVGRERIAEIGSWQGRSTKVLAMLTPGFVWSIDSLVGEVDKPIADQRSALLENLAYEKTMGKVVPLNKSSVDAAEFPVGNNLEMVFIDGSHTFDDVATDILTWAPKLVEGGLLCGHDRLQPGVAEALGVTMTSFEPVAESIWVAP